MIGSLLKAGYEVTLFKSVSDVESEELWSKAFLEFASDGEVSCI